MLSARGHGLESLHTLPVSNTDDYSSEDFDLDSTFSCITLSLDDSEDDSLSHVDKLSLCSNNSDENPIEDVCEPKMHRGTLLDGCSKYSKYQATNELDISHISKLDYHDNITPNYKVISKGLNFHIICRNPNCKIFERKGIIVQLGMCVENNQVCYYAEYMFEVCCPKCCKSISPKDICYIILNDCAVKIKWKISEDANSKDFQIVVKNNDYLFLKVNITEKYNYFKLTLS
ncbi:hypothetical protein LOD99_11055 [Oopsacas minuta]|uniref:Uncharacterized protein n=1 Tax=Oopsacas minuta TaxID=111878 RepID=A0AAV7KBC8_9METZ|nr:hypothetical protein LOD99_11055 [Oopsacas minuta]